MSLLEREKIKKEKEKLERREQFLLKHSQSRFVSDKSQKLRCQTKGCRNGAVTFKGKKRTCRDCK